MRWTLLTSPGWLGVCPSMPGRDGPTYAEQIKVVDEWMPPDIRRLYEPMQWRKCPHHIYAAYQMAVELNRQISGAPKESKS